MTSRKRTSLWPELTRSAAIILTMCPVLKLDPDVPSEDRELEFELAYQRDLTTAERFEMMFRKSRQIMEEMLRRGHRRPFEVLKRP